MSQVVTLREALGQRWTADVEHACHDGLDAISRAMMDAPPAQPPRLMSADAESSSLAAPSADVRGGAGVCP